MKPFLSISMIRKIKVISLIFTAWLFAVASVEAQTDSTRRHSEYVSGTFGGDQLINMPTNEIADGFQFGVQLYFGEIVPSEIANNFLGMDLSPNIRFSFAYPIIKNRLEVEIGRTNEIGNNGLGKTLDLSIKYQVLRQTKNNGMPVSVALYVDPSMATSIYPTVPANSFFADGVTPFQYSFDQRIDYNYQILVTRKFDKNFSFELAPALIYQNLVPAGKANETWVLQGGGRWKFSNHSSLLLDCAYIGNNRDNGTINPLSFGVEFSYTRHIFQIMLGSSNNTLGQDIYTIDNADFTKADFYLNFNIITSW
jgi:hypothetical protein